MTVSLGGYGTDVQESEQPRKYYAVENAPNGYYISSLAEHPSSEISYRFTVGYSCLCL